MVCFDETSTQMLADVRPPITAAPGHPRREDYEYRREGTRNLFLTFEPLAGWRHVEVTERRTKEDFAHHMRWLVDDAYSDVAAVRVVLDNLNTVKGVHKTYQWGGGIVYHRRDDRGSYGRWSGGRLGAR